MQVSIKGKQIDVGDALRTHITDRTIDGVSKYFDRAMEAHVVLSREGSSFFKADFKVHAGHGINLHSQGEADDPYVACDMALSRLEKQLRRYKRRLRNHHDRMKAVEEQHVKAASYVIAPEEDHRDEVDDTEGQQPIIVAENQTEIPTLTVSEAVMRLDFSGDPALMFRNRANDGLNVVYRRNDGNIGWIDPSESAS